MISNEQIKELQQRIETLGRCISVEDKRAEVEKMTQKTLAPDFWDDPKEADPFILVGTLRSPGGVSDHECLSTYHLKGFVLRALWPYGSAEPVPAFYCK